MRTSKVLSLLLICTWLLAACRPAIAPAPATITQTVPAATRQATTTTPLPTATPEPTLTLTGTVHTPIPATQAGANTLASGPDAPASAYRLKTWTKADLQAAIDEEEFYEDSAHRIWSENDYEMTAEKPYFLWDYEEYQATLNFEAKLRFEPADPSISDPWHSMRREIERNGDASRTEPTRALLEQALNSSEAPLDPKSLEDWMTKKGFWTESVLSVNNLFGDGQPAKVVNLGCSIYFAVFIIQGNQPGHMRVHSFPEIWEKLGAASGMSDRYQTAHVIDSNGNGRPEIWLDQIAYPSGWPKWKEDRLRLLEWNPDLGQFVDLAWNIPKELEKLQFGQPLGWTFTSNGEGRPQTLTGGMEYMPDTLTAGRDLMSGDTECLTYTHQVFYEWNGQMFLSSKETWGRPPLPGKIQYGSPAKVVTDSITATQRCSLFWAYRTGPRNDRAIPILESTVNHPPRWLAETFGPAAQDFLRMTLGIWYAERNQPALARANLVAVRDHPANANFTIAGSLARSFLEGYQDSLLTACENVNRMIVAEWGNVPREYYVTSAAVQSAWGFSSPDWFHEFDIDGYRLPICDSHAAFLETASNFQLKDQEDLQQTLSRLKIEFGQIVEADLNGDSRPDWVLDVVQHGSDFLNFDSWVVWALTAQENDSVTPAFLFEFYYSSDEDEFRFVPIKTSPSGAHLYALQGDDHVRVFKIEAQFPFNPRISDDWLLNHSIVSYNPPPSVRVLMDKRSVTDLDFDSSTNNLFIHFEDAPYLDQVQVFHWDEKTGEFHFVSHVLPEPSSSIEWIQELLFWQRKPAEALALLKQILSGPIEEQEVLPRYRPSLQYLLGLSYELLGESDHAVEAYWQLWHDYPKNPYALAVARKLIKR